MTALPKERPILFSAPMVRAILDGSKTQTRRAVKPQSANPAVIPCPYGAPGDRLWVRETWAVQHEYDAAAPSEIGSNARWHYAATENLGGLRKRPSIFLPRRGSRILLEITDVRVQRLQEISEGDARAEGINDDAADRVLMMAEAMNQREPRPFASAFETLWEDINGTNSWAANPRVWAITFRRIEP